MTDTLLIAALKNGDSNAFSQVMDLYGDRLYNAAIGLLHNPQDAEDVVQETLVEVYKNIHQFQANAKLSTWLYRIATNKALECIRAKKRKKRFSFFNARSIDDHTNELVHYYHPEIELEQKEAAAAIFQLIDELPDQQKTAIILHKLEGLSHAEVAEVLESTVPAVEGLIFRAKKTLHAKLNSLKESDPK